MTGFSSNSLSPMPNKHNDPRRHHIPKQRYKLSNWSDYNRSLQRRGRLDLWVNDDLVDCWYHSERVFDGSGSTPVYTDQAILICHEMRVTFMLPLRQVQGFIDSLFEMANLPLKCPDYTLLSKRLSQLKIKTPRYRKQREPDDAPAAIALDSTGLKRFGRDEWHQEKHRVSSKRSWRKMHLGSCDNHYIYAAVMTDKNTMDDAVVDALCEQIDVHVGQISADKAYDENHVYETLEQHFPEADIVIPPKDNLFYDEDKKHAKRCRAMLEIAAKGQMGWQVAHHYGKRALAELAMQRYKRTFGNRLHARALSNQKMEMMIACGVLNRFTSLGMPKSYRCT
ncbi:transposase [Vibrio aestuarianus]|nr:transposase [Vibrio aestuarianus]